MLQPEQIARAPDRQSESLAAFDRATRQRLAPLLTDDLIEEHRRRPVGPHGPALAMVLNYFRRAAMQDKLAVFAIRHFEDYRIVALSGRRGVLPRWASDEHYGSLDEASHAIFLMRVAAFRRGRDQ